MVGKQDVVLQALGNEQHCFSLERPWQGARVTGALEIKMRIKLLPTLATAVLLTCKKGQPRYIGNNGPENAKKCLLVLPEVSPEQNPAAKEFHWVSLDAILLLNLHWAWQQASLVLL